MKKINSFFFYAAMALPVLAASGPANAQTWEPVGTPGFSASGNGVCNWQHLLIAEDNTPYISFNDEGQGLGNGEGTIMKFDGTSWVSVGTPGFTPGIAHHSAFTFGHGDTLYFSFADGTPAGFSHGAVMMFDGSSWTSIGTNLTTGECQYSSVQVDSNGTLYFGAIDNGYANGAMIVKKYDGNNTWSDVGTPVPISDSGAAYGTMRLDRQGTLFVAYQDKGQTPGMVRVKKFDGTSWVNVGNPMLAITGPGAIAAQDIYLAFDQGNTPYVSYSHGFQGPPRLSVEKFNGTDWELVGPAQFSSGTYETSLFSSLALPKDAPYVAYQHGGLNNKASVMKYNPATAAWEHVGPDAISDSTAAFTSIALDGNSNVYVAFFDEAHGDKTTVMKYTVCAAADIQSVTASDTAVCTPGSSVTLTVSGSLNDATSWKWYRGSCTGPLAGTGSSLTVTADSDVTYYVKGMGGCVITGGCSSVAVHMAVAKPTISRNNDMLTSSAASGNQWYENGTEIPGAVSQSYQVSEAGWYYVTVTDGNCTNRSDSVYITPSGISGIMDDSRIRLFPVPFREALHIAIDGAAKSGWTLQVTDQTGRAVYRQSSLSSRNVLPLGDLAPGIYFIRISTPEGSKTFKAVKTE